VDARDSAWESGVADRLPEDTEYRDEGCQVHPACLSCPLAACIYEERYSVREGRLSPRRASLRERDMEIVELAVQGVSSREIGDTYGLSTRQVFRILASERLNVELSNRHKDGDEWTRSSSSGASSSTHGLRRTA
jgi:DNA-binding CsgD family transcriptional regulator